MSAFYPGLGGDIMGDLLRQQQDEQRRAAEEQLPYDPNKPDEQQQPQQQQPQQEQQPQQQQPEPPPAIPPNPAETKQKNIYEMNLSDIAAKVFKGILTPEQGDALKEKINSALGPLQKAAQDYMVQVKQQNDKAQLDEAARTATVENETRKVKAKDVQQAMKLVLGPGGMQTLVNHEGKAVDFSTAIEQEKLKIDKEKLRQNALEKGLPDPMFDDLTTRGLGATDQAAAPPAAMSAQTDVPVPIEDFAKSVAAQAKPDYSQFEQTIIQGDKQRTYRGGVQTGGPAEPDLVPVRNAAGMVTGMVPRGSEQEDSAVLSGIWQRANQIVPQLGYGATPHEIALRNEAVQQQAHTMMRQYYGEKDFKRNALEARQRADKAVEERRKTYEYQEGLKEKLLTMKQQAQAKSAGLDPKVAGAHLLRLQTQISNEATKLRGAEEKAVEAARKTASDTGQEVIMPKSYGDNSLWWKTDEGIDKQVERRYGQLLRILGAPEAAGSPTSGTAAGGATAGVQTIQPSGAGSAAPAAQPTPLVPKFDDLAEKIKARPNANESEQEQLLKDLQGVKDLYAKYGSGTMPPDAIAKIKEVRNRTTEYIDAPVKVGTPGGGGTLVGASGQPDDRYEQRFADAQREARNIRVPEITHESPAGLPLTGPADVNPEHLDNLERAAQYAYDNGDTRRGQILRDAATAYKRYGYSGLAREGKLDDYKAGVSLLKGFNVLLRQRDAEKRSRDIPISDIEAWRNR